MSSAFLGIGHGGRDPGAIANGLQEADINLVVGLATRSELLRHGVEVGISRISNEDDPLSDEIAEANSFKPDIAVEIHTNAGGGDGFEVYAQTNRFAAQSRAIALSIEKEVKAFGQNSRGIKTRQNSTGADYFGWLRQVNCPAVLCEGAFIDTTDRYIIDTVPEQQALGVTYAKGILAYLGIQWMPPGTGEPDNGDRIAELEVEVKKLKEALSIENALRQEAERELTEIRTKIETFVAELTTAI
ncbi:MAG: N-acetylmuramoyl-L-alanine amidase [Angelakisella sp.]